MTKLAQTEYENTIYHDARRYDDEHWWKTDDIDFWVQEFRKSKSPDVLELACGTGRLTLPLVREGARYVGLEISEEFVLRAQQKLQTSGDHAEIIQGDIRNFRLNRKFDLIFIGFNSFLHLLTDSDIEACLQCVQRHLKPAGRFMIDIFIPNTLFLYRPEGMRFTTMEYRDSVSGKVVEVDETNDYDPETEINKITWYYREDGAVDERVYHFSMRMLWPDTMNRLLTDAGFTVRDAWGSYERIGISDENPLQIYTCTQ